MGSTLDMTRPQFLVKFFKNECELDDLKKIFPGEYKKIYSVYNILKKAEIKNDEIVSADFSDDTVSIEFSSKSAAKRMLEYNGELAGTKKFLYTINMKHNGKIVFVKLKVITDNE